MLQLLFTASLVATTISFKEGLALRLTPAMAFKSTFIGSSKCFIIILLTVTQAHSPTRFPVLFSTPLYSSPHPCCSRIRLCSGKTPAVPAWLGLFFIRRGLLIPVHWERDYL